MKNVTAIIIGSIIGFLIVISLLQICEKIEIMKAKYKIEMERNGYEQ